MEKNSNFLFHNITYQSYLTIFTLFSFLIRQEIIFFTYQDEKNQNQIIDWTSIFQLLSTQTTFILSFALSLALGLMYSNLLITKQFSRLISTLEGTIFPIIFILTSKYLQFYFSSSIRSSFLTFKAVILALIILFLLVLNILRNIHFQFQSFPNNLINVNFIDSKYVILSVLKFCICVFLPLIIKSKLVILIAILPITCWKIWILKNQLVLDDISLQYFQFCAEIYSIFCFCKLGTLTALESFSLFQIDFKYMPLTFSLIFITFFIYLTFFKHPKTIFNIQSKKYIKMMQHHVNSICRIKTQRHLNSSTFLKQKILISNLIFHKNFYSENYDFKVELQFDINFILSEYLKIQYERIKNNELQTGELSNMPIKQRTEFDLNNDQNIMSKKNLMFFKRVEKSQKFIENHKNSILIGQQNIQQQIASLSSFSQLSLFEQNNLNQQDFSQYKKKKNLEKVQKIMIKQQDHVQKQGLALVMTQKVIHERGLDQFLQKAFQKCKETIQKNDFIVYLWKILTFDIFQIQPFHQSKLNNLQIENLKKNLYTSLAFNFLKTNSKSSNITKSLYLFYRAYENCYCKSNQQKNTSLQNLFLNYVSKLEFEVNHKTMIQKIGNEQFLSQCQRNKRIRDKNSSEQVLNNKNKCCLQELPNNRSIYEPCFRQFIKNEETLYQVQQKIYCYQQFIEESNIFPSNSNQIQPCNLLDYYSRSYKFKRQIEQLFQKCESQQYIKHEIKILKWIYDKYIIKNNINNVQNNGFKRQQTRYKISHRLKQQILIIQQLNESCICVCSTINKNGYIMIKNNKFNKIFNSSNKKTSNQQIRQRSSFTINHNTTNINQLNSDRLFSTNNQIYPDPIKNIDKQQIIYHINNLILPLFQKDHYQSMYKKQYGCNESDYLLNGIQFHNNFNNFNKKKQQVIFYCVDLQGIKHYQINRININITYLSLDQIYVILQLSRIKQLQYFQIEQIHKYQQEQFFINNKLSGNSKQLIYRYIKSQQLIKKLNKNICSKQKSLTNKQLLTNNMEFRTNNKEFKLNNKQFKINMKIPTKIIKNTLLISCAKYNSYFNKNIVIYKSYVKQNIYSNSSIYQQNQLNKDNLNKSLTNFIQLNEKNNQIYDSNLDKNKISANKSIQQLIFIQPITINFCWIVAFVITILILLALSSYTSYYFQSTMKQFLNLRKITHTAFILNEIFAPIDIMIISNINKGLKLKYLNIGDKRKYLAQVNISISLTMQFFRQSQNQLSIYDDQNTQIFYNLLFKSYLPQNQSTQIQNDQSLSKQSLFISFITEIHQLNQMLILSNSINQTKYQTNRLQRYFKQSLTNLHNFYQHCNWHQYVDLYFRNQRTIFYFTDIIVFVTVIFGYFCCLIGIFIHFYHIKSKIWYLLAIPSNTNQQFKKKYFNNVKKLKQILNKFSNISKLNNKFIAHSSSKNQFYQNTKTSKTLSKQYEYQHKSQIKSFKMPPYQIISSSKVQILFYIIISICLLYFILQTSNARTKIIQNIQLYQSGEQQFLQKLIYTFDMFKILLIDWNQTTDSDKIMLRDQYLLDEKIQQQFNYLQFIPKLVLNNETIKNNMLIEPLCSDFWKQSRWYSGCANPYSTLKNATYIGFIAKANILMKQLKLNRFYLNRQAQTIQAAHLLLKAYESVWNLHKIGYEYLNISHDIFNSLVLDTNINEYWELYFIIIIGIIMISNGIVYMNRFRVWQAQIFSIGWVQDLKLSSDDYGYYINRNNRNIDTRLCYQMIYRQQ